MSRKMSRKMIGTIAVLMTLLMAISGCSAEKKATFRATVIEIGESSLLVTPLEDEEELKSSDQIVLGKDTFDGDVEVEDVLEITYNGEILETYPASLGEVYSVERIVQ